MMPNSIVGGVITDLSCRDHLLVEVVDHVGRACGVRTVDEVHRRPGQLHRAFSVILKDLNGRILLQRRSAAKTRFASLWANACCGHPTPGQPIAASANRRLREELGLEPITLTEAGAYVYYAEDPITGRVEFEYDHVLVGNVVADVPLTPDPNEVADLCWVNRNELISSLDAEPKSSAPWLAGVIARLAEHESTTSPGRPTEPSGGQ
jgi:isopentenyl-diphosphate Delta-isomerase